MWNLDVYTLFFIDAFILFLLGGFMLLAALQGQRNRTLLWASIGMLLGGIGFVLGSFRTQSDWHNYLFVLSNMLLMMVHGCLWTSLRAYAGRPVRWVGLFAGTIIWFLLCQWPWFVIRVDVHISGFALLSLGYMALAMREVWPERRSVGGSVTVVLCVLAVHALFYVYRVVQMMRSVDASFPWAPEDFTLTMLESIFFIVAVSFGILMMVRARVEDQYRHASLHDALTALPNRRALFEGGLKMLERAHHNERSVAALMCDLDFFKRVNDECGHEVGDEVLTLFAQVLREVVPANALCARIGGEEFVAMIPDPGPQQPAELAARIRRKLTGCSSETTGHLSVSIGISLATTAGYDLDKLLNRADQALYEAKAAGRDCARLWPADTLADPHSAARARR
ncbi:MAG: GGDEF domain-containing protein [Sinobacteraceae bacterium]|nr:GGDEF domain-containing protein [Nevskiaceae bacterium]